MRAIPLRSPMLVMQIALAVLLVSLAQAGHAAPSRLSVVQQGGAASCTLTQVGEPIPGGAPVGLATVSVDGDTLVVVADHEGDLVRSFRMDRATGALEQTDEVSLPGGPSAVIVRRTYFGESRVYVTTLRDSSLTAFTMDGVTGALTRTGGIATGGVGPVNLAMGRNNRVLVANADSNDVSLIFVDPATGALTREGTLPASTRPIDVKTVETDTGGEIDRFVLVHGGSNVAHLYVSTPRRQNLTRAIRAAAATADAPPNDDLLTRNDLLDLASRLESGEIDPDVALYIAEDILEEEDYGELIPDLRTAAAYTANLSQVIQLDPAGFRQEARVTSVATAGNQIAVGGFNGAVYRLAATDNEQLNRTGSFSTGGDITDLAFTPGGSHLVVTGGLPGGVRVFDYQSLTGGDTGSVPPACSVSLPDRVSRTVAAVSTEPGVAIVVNEFRPGNRTLWYRAALPN